MPMNFPKRFVQDKLIRVLIRMFHVLSFHLTLQRNILNALVECCSGIKRNYLHSHDDMARGVQYM